MTRATRRWVAAIALVACAVAAMPAAAQRPRPVAAPREIGRCGTASRVRWNWQDKEPDEADYVTVSDERDPIRFRGVGSPHEGTRLEIGARVPISGEMPLAVPLELRARTVLLNHVLVDRTCLLFDAAFGGDPMGTTVSGAIGATLLYRQADDRLRLEIGMDAALPSFSRNTGSDHVQGALGAAMSDLDQLYRWLPNLEWGVRGRLRFETREDADESSFWIAVHGNLGAAQIATASEPTSGLLGGVGVELLVGMARLDGGRWGFRAGPRVDLSISSLWPTDILLPINVDGVLQLALPRVPSANWLAFELEIFGGARLVNWILENETGANVGLRLSGTFDAALAEPRVRDRSQR